MNKLGDLSCNEFLTELASAAPAPGGGGGAAMAGALAAALASMVANLTIGKEKFADREPEVKELMEQAEAERVRLLTLVDEDAAVFNSFMSCYKLPKTTDEEKDARTAAIRAAAKQAATVPLNIARSSFVVLKLADRLVSTRLKYARVCSILRRPIDSVIYFSCTRLLLSAALSRMIWLYSPR